MKKNILLLKIYAIDKLSPVIPIIVYLQQTLIGLNLTEIFTLLSVFSVSILIFEIPSGVFSDLIGRKLTLLVSSLSFLLGSIIFYFASSFNEMILVNNFIWLKLFTKFRNR